MINTNFWITLVAAILNLLLGLLVLVRNPRRPLYLSFFVFSFITAVWVFSVSYFSISPTLYHVRLMYPLGVLVVPAAIIWVDFLDAKTGNIYRKMTVFAIGIITAIISFIPNMVVKAIDLTTLEIVPGPFLAPYGLVLFSLSGYLLYRIIRGLRKTVGIQRTQYQYVLVGGLGFIIVTVVVNLIIPVFSRSTLTFIDAQSSLFFVALAALTIIRHRFMDVRFIAARSLAYFFLIGIFVSVYAFVVVILQRLLLSNVGQISIFQWAVMISLSIIMAITFNPLRLWITKLTDKIFFRNQYDPEVLLSELSRIMSNTVELSNIMEKTIQTLFDQMKITSIFITIFSPSKIIGYRFLGYETVPEIDLTEMQKISQFGIKILEETEDQPEFKKLFDKYDAVASVPLKTAEETLGLIMIGDKKSGDMFSTRDLKIFEIISSEIAINVELRLKVQKALNKLEVANTHLKELDKAKVEFMDIVAHNLRTPLTIINGYLSFVTEPVKALSQSEINENISKVGAGVHDLSTLVGDIVLATSLLNKTYKSIKKEISAREIVDRVVKKYEADIKKKKIDLEVSLDDMKFLGDEVGVKKIFDNLLENAIKFNIDKGKVIIQSKLDRGKKEIVFSVSDTGVGIPIEKQSNLFDKFSRKTDLYNYEYEGVGLGLYLVRLIVKAHNGHLWFESEEGKGSTFSVALPY